MLRSMTGHGQAQSEIDGFRVVAELRAVNNRYFKLYVRGLEGFGELESQVETLVRKTVNRGSINLTLKIAGPDDAAVHEINEAALKAYHRRICEIGSELQTDRPTLDALLLLPGVVTESLAAGDRDAIPWPAVEAALSVALERLDSMRVAEGEAMAADFRRNCDAISDMAKKIEHRAPAVVTAYTSKLTERINQLLAQHSTSVQPADVAREVGVFAERSDISEELVRLLSHLSQFRKFLEAEGPGGKKLEFVIQEMFRESNTIGSKANDAEISSMVIETKSCIERMREMVQNVE